MNLGAGFALFPDLMDFRFFIFDDEDPPSLLSLPFELILFLLALLNFRTVNLELNGDVESG